MWKHKLCVNTMAALNMPIPEQLELFKKVGFHGFFTMWDETADLEGIRRHGDNIGLHLQSIHAPFAKMDRLWYPDEFTEPTVQRLINCIRDCEKIHAPIVVLHAFITFTRNTATDAGIENFARVVEAARDTGVKLAFENTEGDAYLHALMAAFQDEPHVGFCWDTGHEMCYNHHEDLLARYGDRLLCTHLNDNLGILDYEGSTTFHDDLHLLPFDGIADWQGIADRLDACGYEGELTFELKPNTTLNHNSWPIYGHLDAEGYVTHAYMRACRVAALRKK